MSVFSSIETGNSKRLAQETRRKAFQFRGRRQRGKRGDRQAELRGKGVEQIALGQIAHIDQDAAEFVAALFLKFERAIEIFGCNEAAFDEELAQT